METTPTIHERLIQQLQAAGVSFRQVHHAPTLTSEDSARARGEPLGCGAKALLVKADGKFLLLVIPADRKLASRLVKQSLGVKELRFASAEELAALTGLPAGAVPPIGAPILPFPLYADAAIGREFPHVAFNAGTREDSVIMAAADWERVFQPTRAVLTEAPPD